MSFKQSILAICITLCVLVAGFSLGSVYTEKVLTKSIIDYTDIGGNVDI